MFNEIHNFLLLRIVTQCEALAACLFGEAGLARVGYLYLNRPQAARAQSFTMLAYTLSCGSLLLFRFGRCSGLSPLWLHVLIVTCNALRRN